MEREIQDNTDGRRLLHNLQTNMQTMPEVSSASYYVEKYDGLDVITIKDEENDSDVEFVAIEGNGAVETFKADDGKLLTNDNVNCRIMPKIYQCKQCDASFTSACSRLYHNRYHFDIKPYVCSHLHCGLGFTTPFGLTVHANVHQGIQPPTSYSCKLCSQSFCHLALFDQHLNENHTAICLLCDKRYFRYADLMKHTMTHSDESPKCRGCGETFPRYAELSNHIKMCELLHTCNVCHKQFPAESHLNKHKSIHWQHKCIPCGRNFASSTEHIKHLRRVHKGKACQSCKKVFVTTYELAEHQLKNQANTMWDRCLVCNRNFRTHCELTDHLYPEGSERLFYCVECDEDFIYPCGLEIHRSIHSGTHPALVWQEAQDDAAQEIQDEMCVFVLVDDKIIYKSQKMVVNDDGNKLRKPEQEISEGVNLALLDDLCVVSDIDSQYKISTCINGNNVALENHTVHQSSTSGKEIELETQQDLALEMPPAFVVSDDNSQYKSFVEVDQHQSISEKKHKTPQEEIPHDDLEMVNGTCGFFNANGDGNKKPLKKKKLYHSTYPPKLSPTKSSEYQITVEMEDDELLAFADSDDGNPYNVSSRVSTPKNSRHEYITSFQKFIAEDWTILRDPAEATKRAKKMNTAKQIEKVHQIEVKEESLEEPEEFVSIGYPSRNVTALSSK